jgi:hypothetical protein
LVDRAGDTYWSHCRCQANARIARSPEARPGEFVVIWRLLQGGKPISRRKSSKARPEAQRPPWKAALAAQRAERALAKRRRAAWRSIGQDDPFVEVWTSETIVLLADRLRANDLRVLFVRCVQRLAPQVWQDLLETCYNGYGRLNAEQFAEWQHNPNHNLVLTPSRPNWLKRLAHVMRTTRALPTELTGAFSCPECGVKHGVGAHWPRPARGLELDAKLHPSRTFKRIAPKSAGTSRGHARLLVPYRIPRDAVAGVEAFVRQRVLGQDWKHIAAAFSRNGHFKSQSAIRGHANRVAAVLGFPLRSRGRQRRVNVH